MQWRKRVSGIFLTILILTTCFVLAQNEALEQVVDKNPARTAELEVIPAEDGYIIYEQDKDRVHYLNPVAALIYELCSGDNSLERVGELVQEAFGLAEPPVAQVAEAVAKMKDEGLLT